jgi:transposase
MMATEFWLSDVSGRRFRIQPLLPKNQPGARRVDDRRGISGIIHVPEGCRCRWQDCPAVYRPPTTVYKRFHRWARRGLWRRLFEALARADPRRCPRLRLSFGVQLSTPIHILRAFSASAIARRVLGPDFWISQIICNTFRAARSACDHAAFPRRANITFPRAFAIAPDGVAPL